jgi:SRSO17 transposase
MDDDTGFPKKGQYSVGVARQYCGELGKQDNCQVAVTLSIANHDASLPVAYRLYLPKDWASDRGRRRKVGVLHLIYRKVWPKGHANGSSSGPQPRSDRLWKITIHSAP